VLFFTSLKCLNGSACKLLLAPEKVWEVTLSLETMRAVLITARCLLCLYYCCRNAGIGKGMLYVFAPTPTPPWQVLGGVVQMFRVDGHSAAQNM